MEDALRHRIAAAARLLREVGATEVYVFGSTTRATATEKSDVDLAVSGLPPGRFFEMLARVAGVIGRSIDLIDLDEDTAFTRYLKSENELQRVA